MIDATQISIKEYLENIGVETRKEGKRYFCSSPFSRDTNWSFVIYPTNTFFDFSTGHGGNILNLVSRLNGISTSEASKILTSDIKHEKYKANYKKTWSQPEYIPPFDYQKYINTDPEECEQIKAYAASRGITEGYFCGVFFTRSGKSSLQDSRSNWIRVPALGFLHVDKDLKPCGAKFRRINKEEPRFSARGLLGFYILEINPSSIVNTKESVMYVVESESSANSLWMYLKSIPTSRKAWIISRGGVSSAPEEASLPEHLRSLKNKRLIIDYDGNEELYHQRLELYKDLNAQPIKLILPKGEDLNSLYCKNKMWVVENLLLN